MPPNKTSARPFSYTPQNIYAEGDAAVVNEYETFVTGGQEAASATFEDTFKKLNRLLLWPNGLWHTDQENRPHVFMVDMGAGSGRLMLPHIRSLLNLGCDVSLLGIDNSEEMLNRFKRNATTSLSPARGQWDKGALLTYNQQCQSGELIVRLLKDDFNNLDTLTHEVQDFCFYLSNSRSRHVKFGNETELCIKVVSFAQSWHYVKDRERVFRFITELRGDGDECFIIHYEPVGYLRLFDGDFSRERAACHASSFYGLPDSTVETNLAHHLSFWQCFFSLRNKYYPYSSQEITAVNEDVVFQEYLARGFLDIGSTKGGIEQSWEKKLDFEKLVQKIEKPIFSAQWVGLEPDDRSKIITQLQNS